MYERTRPHYPQRIVQWVLDDATRPVRRVLDLGAGTGKLTRVLLELGVEVVAVDPSRSMLDVLAGELVGVEAHLGAAEALSLPTGCVDAVVCAQAWHWVDPERAVPEVARVLRTGGVLGLIWNLRDERKGWVAALSDAMENRDDVIEVASPERLPDLGPDFGEPRYHVVEHAQTLATADLCDFALSRSHVLTRDRAGRDRVIGQVAHLVTTHPISSAGPRSPCPTSRPPGVPSGRRSRAGPWPSPTTSAPRSQGATGCAPVRARPVRPVSATR